MTRPLTLLVDGDNLSHRVFHASRGNRNDAGFVNLVRAVAQRVVELAGRPVTHLVVAFDSSTNVRRERYAGYKASRPQRDPDLDAQMAACNQLIAFSGVSVVCVEGWEADDVLAAYCRRRTDDGQMVLVSSDRDLLQLVDADTSLMRLVGKVADATLLSPTDVAAGYGVTPGQYLDLAAMRGDTSDDLPGVKGVGAKTAAAVLDRFGTLEAALADPDGLVDAFGARGRRLLGSVDLVRHNVAVMSLNGDLAVPAAAPLSDAAAVDGGPLDPWVAALLDACAGRSDQPELF